MNIYKTAAAALIFSATAAFAQGMAAPKDGMAMGKPMTHHKPMKHDSMKSDSMAAPTH
jgi:hypothetical protein